MRTCVWVFLYVCECVCMHVCVCVCVCVCVYGTLVFLTKKLTCIFDITCIFDVTELSLTSDGSQHRCVVLVSLTSLVYLTSLNSALLQMAASTGVLYLYL